MNKHLLLKCLGIFFILILFMLALSMVEYKVSERKAYSNKATRSVANGWSQSQLLAGPVFELSFSKTITEQRFNKELKKYEAVNKQHRWTEFRLLDSVSIESKLDMQERYVGIFKVPVYTAAITLDGTHKPDTLTLPKEAKLESAQLLVSVNDIRGLSEQPRLYWNNTLLSLSPGDDKKLLNNYLQAPIPIQSLQGRAQLKMQMSLRGVDRFGIVPMAKNVDASLQAPWAHPSFLGRYLPSQRQVDETGFSAEWQVNSFASSITKTLKECTKEPDYCSHKLEINQFGAQLGKAVDVYTMTDRALKYGFLFVCLTFVIFSLLELQKRYAIHPIQYGFVGAALAVFYLLVISLSEHIRFDLAYLIGSVACTLLISGYMKVVLGNARVTALLATGFLSLYAMMFAILKSEDYAFLMGTLLIFTLLAGVMFVTRNIRWQHSRKRQQIDPDSPNLTEAELATSK